MSHLCTFQKNRFRNTAVNARAKTAGSYFGGWGIKIAEFRWRLDGATRIAGFLLLWFLLLLLLLLLFRDDSIRI
jgi:hypothetical protein